MRNLNARSKNIIYIAAIIILMYWISQNISKGFEIMGNILGVMAPVIGGGAIAFIVYLPMQQYIKLLKKVGVKKKGVIEAGAYALSVISLLAVFILLLQIIIPELTHTFTVLSDNVPVAYENVRNWVIENQEKFPQLKEWITGIEIDWGDLFKNAASFITGGVAGVFDTTFSVVTVVIGGLYNTLMAIIISIYLLLNREKLASQVTRTFKAYMPEKMFNFVMKLGRLNSDAFSKYIIGKGLDALTIGMMTFVGMTIFQFPYAAMIAVIVGVTAMIPIIGGYIGVALGALLILLSSPVQALWFVIFMLILQTFEGNVIYPKIMGNSVGLPAVWIIIAITVGGGMFGFIGMLVAVPVMSVIYDLVEEAVNNRLEAKEKNTLAGDVGIKNELHSDGGRAAAETVVGKGGNDVKRKTYKNRRN